MKRFFQRIFGTQGAAGFSLVEMLTTLSISGIVLAAVMQSFAETVAHARDHQIRVETLIQAQAVMQTMVGELRMAGNGVPFDQANFEIGETTLSDPTVTLPILLSTTDATQIDFRLNESGEIYLLTSAFDPSSTFTISLSEVTGLDINDPIYISNSVMSGDEGLSGTIAAVDTNAKTVTINPTYITTSGAQFPMGSVLEKVPTIRYTNSGGDIVRDSGLGPVVLGTNSSVSFEYLDYDGTALSLPLTEAMLVNQLRSIRISINRTSTRLLRNGEPYSISINQVVGIRNLNLYF